MDWQLSEENDRLARLQDDIADAFDRARQGCATDADWKLMAWQLGIQQHYNRNDARTAELAF